LIKMAFTASTANIMEIRLEGLNVLRDVIENFKRSSDVDFDDSPLLEQHQDQELLSVFFLEEPNKSSVSH